MEYYIESQDILKSSFYIEKNIGKSSVNTRHFHSYYEFYYLKGGNIDYLVDDKIYNLKAGSLLIIPPYTIHKNVDADAADHTRIVMYVDKNSFAEAHQFQVKLFDKAEMQFYYIENESRIYNVINEMLNEFTLLRDINMAKLLMLEFLLLLPRQKKIYVSSVEKKMQNKQISQIINFVNTEYATDISLNSLAENFGLNPTYLSRFFKKQTGFNFSVYLNNLRISKAVNILCCTDYNITEAALSVGFHSCNHFCKIFKEIMGISPLAYKKKVNNKIR